MKYMKDNTNLELPSKRKGLKMSFSEKITSISCQIDFSDSNHISLIFKPLFVVSLCLYRMVVRFVLRKDSISLILAIIKKWIIDVDKCSHTFTAYFMYVITNEKKVSQSVSQKYLTVKSRK